MVLAVVVKVRRVPSEGRGSKRNCCRLSRLAVSQVPIVDRPGPTFKSVGRTSNAPAASVEDVGLDQRRADIGVPQQHLSCPNVVAIRQ